MGEIETLRVRAVVPKDHRVEITLPENVPEGPVDMVVTLTPASGESDEARRVRVRASLAGLAALRDKYAHLDLRLSETVIEMRREEG